jgi:hypothetical protein
METENQTDNANWEHVIVPPGHWHVARVIGQEPTGGESDPRVVVEIYHDNDKPIGLKLSDDGRCAFAGKQDDYPPNGWRMRVMPWADCLLARLDDEPVLPIGEPDALVGHPMEDPATRPTVRTTVDAGHATEEMLALLISDGMAEQVGHDGDGSPTFRLTESGQQRAREILGRLE